MAAFAVGIIGGVANCIGWWPRDVVREGREQLCLHKWGSQCTFEALGLTRDATTACAVEKSYSVRARSASPHSASLNE